MTVLLIVHCGVCVTGVCAMSNYISRPTLTCWHHCLILAIYCHPQYISELPTLLPINDVVEALLYVDGSFNMIMKVIINSPWSVTEGKLSWVKGWSHRCYRFCCTVHFSNWHFFLEILLLLSKVVIHHGNNNKLAL